MVDNAATHVSGLSQDPVPKEKGAASAEITNEGSEEKSPEILLAELSGIPAAEKSDSKEDAPPDPPKQETKEELKPAEKGDDTSDTPKEDDPPKGDEPTLETFFEEEEPISFQKKPKFPDISEGDIDRSGEVPIIKSKHVYDDMAAIFGSEEKNPDLRVFLKINNSKPKKANELAKLAGFRSRHHFAAVIEEMIEATNEEEKQEIVDREFPEWSHTDSDVEPPFKVDIQKKEEPKSEIHGRKFQWSQEELDRAINDYVADNDITKQALLKNAKLSKLLGEFSGLSRGGKVLSATEVLSIVVPMAGVAKEPEPVPKALGGAQKPKQPGSKSVADSSIIELGKSMGLDGAKLQKFLDSKK